MKIDELLNNAEYAESYPLEIAYDHVQRMKYMEHPPCKHASPVFQVTNDNHFNDKTEPAVKIPRTITARNEGGYNCTTTCLDCLLEIAQHPDTQHPKTP